MTRLFEAKPFIIAEVGSNWETLEHCLQSISAAKDCGADAVKFQAFNAEALYGPGQPNPIWTLPLDWLPLLKAHADAVGTEFMCTAFSPKLLAAVDPYVEVHKVASSDAAWPQMLEAVARMGKPALVSLGAQYDASHEWIMGFMSKYPTWISMDCVAAYPADFVDLDLCGDGFSDHTLGYTATVEAARIGVRVIEKHFTAFPDLNTPDRPHSLTPKQFRRMVDIIRGREVESEETAMFLRHKRRLIATKDINPGDTLRYGENYGAYRSLEDDSHGVAPFLWNDPESGPEGKKAILAVGRGKGLGKGDF